MSLQKYLDKDSSVDILIDSLRVEGTAACFGVVFGSG